jgi:hypothetical protein
MLSLNLTLTTTNSSGGGVLPCGRSAFNLMLTPGSGTTYRRAGLERDRLACGRDRDLLPGNDSGGQWADRPVTMTIQTISPQTAHSEVAATTLARVAAPIERGRSMIRACRRVS